MNTQTEAQRLADDYAISYATAHLEAIYGTSKSYTKERVREANEARELLQAELRRLEAEVAMTTTLHGKLTIEAIKAQTKCIDLEAANAELLTALVDVSYTLEKARIWGGMEWKYNPLHPVHYLPARDKARAVIENHGGAA